MKWLKEKAWPWLKSNWQWVVFPIGILLFILRALVGGRTVEVTSSELSGAAEFQNELDREAEAQALDAKKVRDEKVEKIVQRHEQEVQVLTDAQRSMVDELKDDPDALNEFLLDVGKKVRSDRG